MELEKTLGQIAHETGEEVFGWVRRWDDMCENQKKGWEAMAQAVADELRKSEWICLKCGIRQASKQECKGDF